MKNSCTSIFYYCGVRYTIFGQSPYYYRNITVDGFLCNENHVRYSSHMYALHALSTLSMYDNMMLTNKIDVNILKI